MRLLLFLFLACFLPLRAEALTTEPTSFSQIPILHEGRIKPLDTFARTHLQLFSGKTKLPDMSAQNWLAEMIFTPPLARTRPVFYISNPDILQLFKFEKRKKHLYSFADLADALLGNKALLDEALQTSPKDQTAVQRTLSALYEKSFYYADLTQSLSTIAPDFIVLSEDLAENIGVEAQKPYTYLQMMPLKSRIKEILDPQLKQSFEQDADDPLSHLEPDSLRLIAFTYRMKEIEESHQAKLLRVLPPQWKSQSQDNEGLWLTFWEILEYGQGSPKILKLQQKWSALTQSYRDDDQSAFAEISREISTLTLEASKDNISAKILPLEVRYNNFDLFGRALELYILSFLFLLASPLIARRPMAVLSVTALALGGLVHVSGIILRMIIMARPPVTTLYESILFVGAITVLFALIMEWRRKDGRGTLTGALSGAILLFMASRYAAEGDTMGMLQAVLDTNFWLSTHVVTISIGYGACLVAGILAHFYIYERLFKSPQRAQELLKTIRATALIALFFTALGTILGGIWADQSWGRFWGWDPKENGALLIVLWLIWLLHGRFSGFFSESTFACGMVLTNIIVAMAWFGVNLLGVGLHSYGFTSGIALNLALFSAVELFIAGGGYFLIRRSAL